MRKVLPSIEQLPHSPRGRPAQLSVDHPRMAPVAGAGWIAGNRLQIGYGAESAVEIAGSVDEQQRLAGKWSSLVAHAGIFACAAKLTAALSTILPCAPIAFLLLTHVARLHCSPGLEAVSPGRSSVKSRPMRAGNQKNRADPVPRTAAPAS
jgi:hypothetical protein